MPNLNPNLYIIGTAEYGISNTPILINNEEHLMSIFGKKGSLLEAYRKVMSITEVPNVYLYKCNGRHSRVYANIVCEKKIIFKGVEFKSTYSTDEDNGIIILFTDDFMQIIKGSKSLEYNFSKYDTIYKLFKAVNSDADNGISPVCVINYTLEQVSHPRSSLVSCNKPILITDGGSNGIDNNIKQIYTSMKDNIYDLLGEQIDCIIFADCYIDDTYVDLMVRNKLYMHSTNLNNDVFYKKPVSNNRTYIIRDTDSTPQNKNFLLPSDMSFYELMLDFCCNQLKYNIVTKGVIGFKPFNKNKDDNIYIENLAIEYYNSIIKDINLKYDNKNLSLISVTFGDVYYDNHRTIDNHYIAYASTLCSEPYETNITNVDYGNKVDINSYLSINVIDVLKKYNFIFVRKSPLTGNVHIVNANSMSSGITSCEYVTRSLQLCYKTFNNVFDDILGEDVNNNTEQKFNLLVRDTLKSLSEVTPITKYDYTFKTVLDTTVLEIDLYFPNFINPIKYFVTK